MKTIPASNLFNIFMTIAWYGHLKYRKAPLITVIVVSWLIAFAEYCFQVPANRLGYGEFTAFQLKIIQEIITLCVFVSSHGRTSVKASNGIMPSRSCFWSALWRSPSGEPCSGLERRRRGDCPKLLQWERSLHAASKSGHLPRTEPSSVGTIWQCVDTIWLE